MRALPMLLLLRREIRGATTTAIAAKLATAAAPASIALLQGRLGADLRSDAVGLSLLIDNGGIRLRNRQQQA